MASATLSAAVGAFCDVSLGKLIEYLWDKLSSSSPSSSGEVKIHQQLEEALEALKAANHNVKLMQTRNTKFLLEHKQNKSVVSLHKQLEDVNSEIKDLESDFEDIKLQRRMEEINKAAEADITSQSSSGSKRLLPFYRQTVESREKRHQLSTSFQSLNLLTDDDIVRKITSIAKQISLITSMMTDEIKLVECFATLNRATGGPWEHRFTQNICGTTSSLPKVETIWKIKHRNLVPLLGYCKVGDERLLVYEYMKFGSLDVVLHDKTKGGTKLDWTARKKIAVGSARGLAFLHHRCCPHIIHRDMKSSNVLLDENLEARVSDFGMACLMNALDIHLSVSTLAGTPGYVPPEYYQSFRCSTKGNVYSFGVVLLELLSGKKPIDPLDFGDNNLVGWVKQMMKEDKSTEIFDPELMISKSGENELYQYLKIACECLDDRPFKRPTMIQVMAMFQELQMDNTDSNFLDLLI